MRKYLILLIIPLLLIFGSGCEKKLKTYEEIDYDKFITMINNKEDFILFIGSETCSHCQEYKNTVNKIVEDYGLKIYYIDINKFTPEQSSKFGNRISFKSTPTTVFINDGEEKKDESGNVTIYRIVGNLPIDKVITKLKKAGYIKE